MRIYYKELKDLKAAQKIFVRATHIYYKSTNHLYNASLRIEKAKSIKKSHINYFKLQLIKSKIRYDNLSMCLAKIEKFFENKPQLKSKKGKPLYSSFEQLKKDTKNLAEAIKLKQENA